MVTEFMGLKTEINGYSWPSTFQQTTALHNIYTFIISSLSFSSSSFDFLFMSIRVCKMRKSMYHKQASIQLENHHPGCMWGALHMLDYLAWRQVRKMLPYKRHGARRNGNNGHIIQGEDSAQRDDSSVEERMTESSHHTGHSVRSNKGSVRARLKSRIVEDILRRKGNKHRRSSTCPTQLKTDPACALKVDGKDSNHMSEHDASATSVKSEPLSTKVASALPLESKDDGKVQWVTFGDTSVDNQRDVVNSETMLIQETLENAKEALLEQKLMSAKEHNSEAPLHQSKEFLDALNLVNLDKDLLQGILQEHGSSHPFQTQKSFKMATGSSVPESGSTSPKKQKSKQDASPTTMASQEGAFFHVDGETAGSPSPRNKEKSQVAIRHFKILQRRLRHAVKESKKEKHHITMDGVLHKIPYGQKPSADVKEITSYWKERSAYRGKKEASLRSCGSSPIHQKTKISHFRRTSSMGDSMEKYCWLYESSFNKKPDQPLLENSKETNKEEQTKKSFERILSMPDLKSYYYIPSEYLNDSYATRSPSRPAADAKNVLSRNLSFVFEPLNERKLTSTVTSSVSDEYTEPLANSIGVEQLNIMDDAFSPTLTATPTCNDLDQDFEFSFPQASAITFELSSSDEDLPPKEDLLQKDEADSAGKNLREPDLKDYMYLQVDLKDEVEFKYVKHVLDLSGLSRNHPHESWYATDQPVDPAMFEEVVEGFEEGSDSYNHLILFDLINEVLMDMYEKSFSYCPVSLSSLCRLRAMPKGDRVLNEVWSNISWYFSSRPAFDDKLDYVIERDLSRSSGWMNLQFDTECIGLELEDMIFDDLLDETVDE